MGRRNLCQKLASHVGWLGRDGSPEELLDLRNSLIEDGDMISVDLDQAKAVKKSHITPAGQTPCCRDLTWIVKHYSGNETRKSKWDECYALKPNTQTLDPSSDFWHLYVTTKAGA
jgi:hypothetical protein